MLPFARFGFGGSGATFLTAQVGNAGNAITPLGQTGVRAGDYAVWVDEGSGPPSSGWTSLDATYVGIYGKILVASDLTISSSPSKPWAIAVYRDVKMAAKVAVAGFAKSVQHAGIVAVNYQVGNALTSPTGMRLAAYEGNAPQFGVFDRVLPNPPYVNGTAFTPNTNLIVLELRN